MTRKMRNLLTKPVDALADVAVAGAALCGVVGLAESGRGIYHQYTDTHTERIRSGIFKKKTIVVRNFDGKIVG